MKRYSHEGPNALLEHVVLSTQVHTEVEALDSAAEDPLLFQVCKHAPCDRARLIAGRPHLDALAQRVHLIRALLHLVPATRLHLGHVPCEIPRRHRLCRLHNACDGRRVASFADTLPLTRGLMGLIYDRETVVGASVRIEAEADGEAFRGARQPFAITLAEDAAQRVALSWLYFYAVLQKRFYFQYTLA